MYNQPKSSGDRKGLSPVKYKPNEHHLESFEQFAFVVEQLQLFLQPVRFAQWFT